MLHWRKRRNRSIAGATRVDRADPAAYITHCNITLPNTVFWLLIEKTYPLKALTGKGRCQPCQQRSTQ